MYIIVRTIVLRPVVGIPADRREYIGSQPCCPVLNMPSGNVAPVLTLHSIHTCAIENVQIVIRQVCLIHTLPVWTVPILVIALPGIKNSRALQYTQVIARLLVYLVKIILLVDILLYRLVGKIVEVRQ